MAWTDPATQAAATGDIITAGRFNIVNDNLLDLHRRTSPVAATVATIESTTSTVYTDLATTGPAVTVVIGSTGKALVALYCALSNAGGNFALASYAVSGATTVAASDVSSLQSNTTSDVRMGATLLQEGLVSGNTTFSMKYRATGTTAAFNGRRLMITPLGS